MPSVTSLVSPRSLILVIVGCAALTACGGARLKARGPAADPESVALGDLPEGAFSSPAPVCRTSCAIPSASEATPACTSHVAAGLDPAMSSLRVCLSAMGAGEIEPVILATYGHDGALSNALIDLGGVEAAGCVARARPLLPERTTDASGFLRCSQRCVASP